MELAHHLWVLISMCLPMRGGGCGGTVSLLAQGSSSVLSQGRAGRDREPGLSPLWGQGAGVRNMPGPWPWEMY